MLKYIRTSHRRLKATKNYEEIKIALNSQKSELKEPNLVNRIKVKW